MNFNKITNHTYYNSETITDEEMVDTIDTIGLYAYAETANLKSIKLSKNLKIIESFAFANSGIMEIKFPNTLKIIGSKAFSGCKNLKKIVIPEGVINIGYAAFANCVNLEEVYLPNSLKELPTQLFLNCRKLKKVHLPDGTTILPDEIFKDCKSLDLNLDGIESLGNGVFNGCTSLTHFPSLITEFQPYEFRGCNKLRSVKINDKVKYLPDHLFDGCTNLNEVIIEGEVSLGNKVFKNCTSLKNIPKNIIKYGKYDFENCTGFTSITMNSSHINEGTFRGCTNLSEIKDWNRIRHVDTYALSNTGFVNIDLSKIETISSNILSNSKKLKEVKLGNHQTIGSYAFFRCINLDVNLTPFITSVGKMAFAYNKKTKELIIPPYLKIIGDGAFSYSNYETIKSHDNQNFITFNDKILINQIRQEVIQYACGTRDKYFSVAEYSEQDFESGTLICPLIGIAKYAFAGAKYLEEIELPSCISDIEITSFQDSPNLKTLDVRCIDMYALVNFTTKKNGYVFFDIDLTNPDSKTKSVDLPFEILNFHGNNIQIGSASFNLFKKIKEVNFSNDSFITIALNVFDNTSIMYAYIPKNVREIRPNAFKKDCTLDFEDSIKRNDILCVDYDSTLTYPYRVFTLQDNSYLVEGNDHIISISDESIKKYIKQNDCIYKKPTKVIDYIYNLQELDLVQDNFLLNGILINLNKEIRKQLLEYYKYNSKITKLVLIKSGLLTNNDKYSQNLLNNKGIIKLLQFIDLAKKYNIEENELLHRALISENSLDNLEFSFYNYKDLLVNIIRTSNIFNSDSLWEIANNNNLIKFLFFITKYNLKDPFLFNPCIINLVKNPEYADKLFKNYDNNMKRLIKSANVLDTNNLDNSTQNLMDLLNLIYITGGFESDAIIKQRALTFITEKITLDYDNGKSNERKITGDNFHRLFNFGNGLRSEFDLEFANFFLENYNAIYDREIRRSGFIERAYSNFRKISRTSTADTGSQRHKKVTMEKVINFLIDNKFSNVSYEDRELADFIGQWYNDNNIWLKVKEIIEESKNSPRNIFTKITYDDEGKPIYDMDPKHDLKDDYNNNYNYEWLNKKAPENLVLGKYCSCCAHINGAGAGIMRASIILDNVQNLVIKDNLGEIVAKSTLYINRENGYGVFNNVEVYLKIQESDLEEIYQAFMRGAKRFLSVYNENNDIRITKLTIGSNRNRIKEKFKEHNHQDCGLLKPINYGKYGYNGNYYSGDASNSQILVLKS